MTDEKDQRDARMAELLDSARGIEQNDDTALSNVNECFTPVEAQELLHLVRDLDAAADNWKGPIGTLESVDDLIGLSLPGGRYGIVSAIARGGMGAVYRALDSELERPLAVKVMSAKLVSGGVAERRFLDEARITGQLQHPGIPPIHEIGHLLDGRPFFAMKLIEGRDLHHLLKERATTQAELPRYLQVFAQISQTLAYAHARGVIHRDLKPANVMVGAFGEVQVMDWGLAKRLRTPDAADERTTSPSQVDRADATEAGTVLGTLAFMAPEQAQGRIDTLDERSDVFGLGAVLCVILTGSPPYAESTRDAVWRQAAHAELGDALRRLDACGADAELISLAKDCLAAEPAARPTDAGAVAQRINVYLESVQQRLKAAEIQQAADRTRAVEESKRRRVLVALVACALLLVLGAAAAVGRYYVAKLENDVRRQQVERDATGILAAAGDVLNDLDAQLSDPVKHRSLMDEPVRWRADLASVRSDLKRAEDLLDGAPAEIDPQFTHTVASLSGRLKSMEDHRQIIRRLEGVRMDASALVKDRWPVAIRQRYQEAFSAAGFDILGKDSAALAARMRASPLRWPLVAALDHWAAGMLPSYEGGGGPESDPKADKELAARLLQLARAADPSPWSDRFRDMSVWESRKELGELADDPQALAQSPQLIEALALATSHHGPAPEALLRRALLRHPRDVWLQYRMAWAVNDRVERLGYLRTVVAIRPGFSMAHRMIGLTLTELGRRDEARDAYLKAVEVDPNNATAHNDLGMAAYGEKRYDQAVAFYNRAIQIDDRYVVYHHNLGVALLEQGQTEQAIARLEKAVKLDAKFAFSQHNLGRGYLKLGHIKKAIDSLQRAVDLSPFNAVAQTELGVALAADGQLDKAVERHKKALEINPLFVEAHASLGGALMRQEKLDEAAAAYGDALKLRPDYALAHYNLGRVLLRQRKHSQAATHLSRAVVHDPRNVDAHILLGQAHRHIGQLDKAESALREASTLAPNDWWAQQELAIVLQQQKKVPEALAIYQKILSLRPKDGAAHYNLAVVLAEDGQVEPAIAAYRKTIEFAAQNAHAHRNLGLLLKKEGRFAEALPLFKRGHELGSQQKGWPDPTGGNIKDCQRLLTADNQLTGILKGESPPNDSAEFIALADLCRQYKKNYHLAVRFYKDAFANDRKTLETPASARYNAACAAVLASDGQGQGEKIDEPERAQLREQALQWLKSELVEYHRMLKEGSASQRQLARTMVKHLPTDTDLALVRDPIHTARLPSAQAVAWREFWMEIDKLGKLP